MSLKLTAEVGLEFKAKTSLVNGVKSSAHDCDFCVDGDISLKLELSGKIDSSLKVLRVSGKLADFSLRLGNFYFSIREGTAKFGWGKCPYLESGNVQIPDDAIYFNGHSYKVYELSMTWTEARTFCESLGGHLAVITSQEEQDYIESVIRDGNKFQYWLGATDELVEGRWEWVTGEEWHYTNWDVNMPDNNRRLEHYLQIYRKPNPHVSRSQAYKWNDITIDNVYRTEPDFFLTEYVGFICEWDSTSH